MGTITKRLFSNSTHIFEMLVSILLRITPYELYVVIHGNTINDITYRYLKFLTFSNITILCGIIPIKHILTRYFVTLSPNSTTHSLLI